MPDSRTLWTAVVIICIAVSVFFSVKKRTTFKRLQQLMAAKQWDEFDRLLDGKLTSMLYPRYNRDYLRLNSYLLREAHEHASEMFDTMILKRHNDIPELERMLEDVGDDPVKRCRLEYLLALQYQNKGDEAKFQEFLEKSGQHSMAVNA